MTFLVLDNCWFIFLTRIIGDRDGVELDVVWRQQYPGAAIGPLLPCRGPYFWGHCWPRQLAAGVLEIQGPNWPWSWPTPGATWLVLVLAPLLGPPDGESGA